MAMSESEFAAFINASGIGTITSVGLIPGDISD